jgi:hypothetical protein
VNLRVQCLCHAGDLAGALRLLGSDGGVYVWSYCTIVQLCGEERSLEASKRVHALIRASSAAATDGKGSVLGKRLVLVYLKCGDLGEARTVFDGMPHRLLMSVSGLR